MPETVTDLTEYITPLTTTLNELIVVMGSNVLISAAQVEELGALSIQLAECANAAVQKSQTVPTDPEAPPTYDSDGHELT